MLKLYSAPRTRAVRIVWLLEELGLPYELTQVEFKNTASEFFIQDTPTGKLPTLVDGDVVICESGAIAEYLLEIAADWTLAPEPGNPRRGAFLQWLHFAEATAFAPLGVVVWLSVYRDDADRNADLIRDARRRAAGVLSYVEKALGDGLYLLGDQFSAADIMMGFTLQAARLVGVLGEEHPRLAAYVARLAERPAFQKALRLTGTSGV